MSPARSRAKVDLPEPFAPITAIRGASRRSVTSSSAVAVAEAHARPRRTVDRAAAHRTTSNTAATPIPPPTEAAASPIVPAGAPPRTSRENSRTTADGTARAPRMAEREGAAVGAHPLVVARPHRVRSSTARVCAAKASTISIAATSREASAGTLEGRERSRARRRSRAAPGSQPTTACARSSQPRRPGRGIRRHERPPPRHRR